MDEPDILAASHEFNMNIIVHRLNENPIHYHRSANAPRLPPRFCPRPTAEKLTQQAVDGKSLIEKENKQRVANGRRQEEK